jgi:hypothetical protein
VSPTIVKDGQFRLFFFSREEPRIHVHVAHPDGEAKFWLTPQVHLAVNIGLTSKDRSREAAIYPFVGQARWWKLKWEYSPL